MRRDIPWLEVIFDVYLALSQASSFGATRGYVYRVLLKVSVVRWQYLLR
jgi:hypothetical protein